MMRKNNLKVFLMLVLIVLITLSISFSTDAIKAQTFTISENLALDLALSYSRDKGMDGWLIPPEKAYGQVMNYGEAVQFVLNRSIDPNTKQFKKRNKLVWLIILEGEFIEHVPASAGGDVPAKEVIHNQMVVILDGKTGDIMRTILPPSEIKLPVASLPTLQRSNEELPPMPTHGPIVTEAPYLGLPPVATQIP